jgi:hypothetical protein
MLDDELAALTLLRALPESDSVWTSSLMMNPVIKCSDVKTHFTSQESLQSARGVEMANKIGSKSPTSPTDVTCTFCNWHSHADTDCQSFKVAQREAKEKTHQRRKEWQGKNMGKGKAAKADISDKVSEQPQKEAAGNASAFIPDPSDPTCALLVHASSDWTADTGASSHMTPHRHWFSSYKPHQVPIQVANGHTIMSAGVGAVRFKPKGKGNVIIEFQRVLHVPHLTSNLLSVLYLTKKKNFRVSIFGSSMSFYQNKVL